MSFTLLSESKPVARKAHRCFWCYEKIEIGEKHIRYTGKFDGDFQDTRMHSECYAAMGRAIKSDPYLGQDGFMPGSYPRGKEYPEEGAPTPMNQNNDNTAQIPLPLAGESATPPAAPGLTEEEREDRLRVEWDKQNAPERFDGDRL